MSKVWLVTGSSRGLGKHVVEAALAAGDRVVATARRKEDLAGWVAAHPERVLAVRLDVTNADDARAAIAATKERFGRLDVLVNNAGYANTTAIEDADETDFRAQIETNFFGPFHLVRAALPLLRAQGSGHVVNVSSLGGRLATPGIAAYQSAKWALGGFSEVLAKEVAPLGIKVTVVEPGGIRTDWAGSSMRVDTPSAPYRATVGAVAELVRTSQDAVRGDPARAAAAILEVVASPTPPLRLLLGTDAIFLAGIAAAARAEEDARWRDVSASMDYPGLPPFADTPIGKALLGKR